LCTPLSTTMGGEHQRCAHLSLPTHGAGLSPLCTPLPPMGAGLSLLCTPSPLTMGAGLSLLCTPSSPREVPGCVTSSLTPRGTRVWNSLFPHPQGGCREEYQRYTHPSGRLGGGISTLTTPLREAGRRNININHTPQGGWRERYHC